MKLIESYPAFDVLRPESDIIDVTPNMELDINGRSYTAGSIETSAIEYGEDVAEAIARYERSAKENPYAGHKFAWLNNNASIISNAAKKRGVRFRIEVGDRIRLGGRVFRVEHERFIYYNLVEV